MAHSKTKRVEVKNDYSKDIEWLKKLDSKIWKEDVDDNQRGIRIPWHEETRLLTKEELRKIFKIIRGHELPCEMCSGTFGFGIGIRIYSHSPLAEIKPEFLIAITNKHLPGFEKHRDPVGYIAIGVFARFTHSKRNKEILAFYRFPEQQEPIYYYNY